MRIPPWLPLVAIASAVALPAAADPGPDRTGVVERVVAVVDRRVVLLSELRARSKPFKKQIERAVPEGAQRAAAWSQVMTELLSKMVDELLIAADADRLRVTVSREDVDAALKTLSDAQKISIPELLAKAKSEADLDEADYRDELRRQILEGKMIRIRVHGQMKDFAKLSEEERNKAFEAERQVWIEELRKKSFIEKKL